MGKKYKRRNKKSRKGKEMEVRKRGNRKYQERSSKAKVNIQNLLNKKIEKEFNIKAKKF